MIITSEKVPWRKLRQCKDRQSLQFIYYRLYCSMTSYELQITEIPQDSVQKLKEEVKALREQLFELLYEREHLFNIELRDIEAAYMQELGNLEVQIYHAQCEAMMLRRKLELMRACLNRQEPICMASIEQTLLDEYTKYEQQYEEFIRIILEAADYIGRRKQQQQHKEQEDTRKLESGESGTSLQEGSGETEEQELKRLYRKIVKALHPDLQQIAEIMKNYG